MSEPRCSAVTASGEPCRNFAAHGFERCSVHLGLAKQTTKLTPEVADQLVASMQAGNYVIVACKAAGVNRITYNGWMARGRSSAVADAPFHELRERVTRARAQAEARAVTQIARAAQTNWQAAAWLLERQAPERWAKPSVRVRDVEPERPPEPKPNDPFTEVDELAARRRQPS